MQYQLPHTIQNKYGEKLIFLRMEGQRLFCDNEVMPNAGPPMHIHHFQDECLTVVAGKMGYQIAGEAPQYAGPGETALFKRGIEHRFWNAGDDILCCTGWVDPADNLIFFLTSQYEAIDRGKNHRPEIFDAAYLTWRYRHEFSMTELPVFVRNSIIPVIYFIGKLLGKYQKFSHAPKPLKAPADRPAEEQPVFEPAAS